jgi:hypothetical protein
MVQLSLTPRSCFGSTTRLETLNVRLRSALAYITSQLPHQVRVLGEDATLQRVALLPAHSAYVQRVRVRGLVHRLLKLTAVDELHIGDRRSSRFSRILVLEAAPKSGQHSRKIIVERGCRTFAEPPPWVLRSQSRLRGCRGMLCC